MKALFTTLAAATMLALPLAPALADTAPPVPQLQANGSGEVKVVPDIAIVTLGVTTRGETAAGALAENSTDLDNVIATIGAAGVASKDIATTGLSVNPVYENRSQPSDQPAKIVGYEVSNQIRVIVRDTAGSAAIIDKVVQSGANQIYGIGFDVEDRAHATETAIRAAIAEARAKAELMAEAAGVRLVRILTINAGENYGGPSPMLARDSSRRRACR